MEQQKIHEYSMRLGCYIYQGEKSVQSDCNLYVSLIDYQNQLATEIALRKEVKRLNKIIESKQTVYKENVKATYDSSYENHSSNWNGQGGGHQGGI
jgi:hypothetical protein